MTLKMDPKYVELLLKLKDDRTIIAELEEHFNIIHNIKLIPSIEKFKYPLFCNYLNLNDPYIRIQSQQDYNSLKSSLEEFLDVLVNK